MSEIRSSIDRPWYIRTRTPWSETSAGFSTSVQLPGKWAANRSGRAGCGSAPRTTSWLPGAATIRRRRGQVREHPAELGVLLVDVRDHELALLARVDPDPVHEVARDQQVADLVALVEPVGEPVPGIGQEGVRADVDVGDQDGLPRLLREERRVVDRDIGAEDLLGVEERPLVRELAAHADHLVRDEPLGLVEVGPVLVEEDRDHARRVLELDEPVALRGRPALDDHPDDRALLLPVPARGSDERLDRHRVDPGADEPAQARVPVAEVVDVVLDRGDRVGRAGARRPAPRAGSARNRTPSRSGRIDGIAPRETTTTSSGVSRRMRSTSPGSFCSRIQATTSGWTCRLARRNRWTISAGSSIGSPLAFAGDRLSATYKNGRRATLQAHGGIKGRPVPARAPARLRTTAGPASRGT